MAVAFVAAVAGFVTRRWAVTLAAVALWPTYFLGLRRPPLADVPRRENYEDERRNDELAAPRHRYVETTEARKQELGRNGAIASPYLVTACLWIYGVLTPTAEVS